MRLIIAVTVCNLLLGTVAEAQKKSGSRRSTPPAPVQSTQPPPPPQKSKEQEMVDKDIATLSSLSAEDKETVRQAVEALVRTIRTRDLMGYDKYLLDEPETQKTYDLIMKAKGFVPNTIFEKALSATWRAVLDSYMADSYYRKGLSDDLIELVDRYKLNGVAGVLIGDEIHKISIERLDYVYTEAKLSGIVHQPE